jgi:uncharacterized membrane protein YdbT with pleckstrin-like domain
LVGTFDTVATVITDLANASISVLRTVTTGDNAGVVIGAVVVVAVVLIIVRFAERHSGKKMY